MPKRRGAPYVYTKHPKISTKHIQGQPTKTRQANKKKEQLRRKKKQKKNKQDHLDKVIFKHDYR